MTRETPHPHRSHRPSALGCGTACGQAAEQIAQPRCSKLDELRRRTTCSVEEASVLLGIGRSTAYAAARDGSLPVLRISKRLLVPTAKLLAMIGLDQAE